jgi:hypothetical protein
VEVPDEERGGAGAVAAPAVADHDRAAPVVGSAALAVEAVPARLDLVVVRRLRGEGRLGRRREVARVGPVHGGGGDWLDARDVWLVRLPPHGWRRGQRERRRG